MQNFITPRVGYGLPHPALERASALQARLAKLRFEAPAFADRNGEPYFDGPAVELDAPPEILPIETDSTPAALDAVEAIGAVADAQAAHHARMHAHQIERAGLRIERAELLDSARDGSANCREELARIKARLSDLDDYLILEPDCDFEATPWGDCDPIDESEIEPEPAPKNPLEGVIFRGSALFNGAVLIGRMETNVAAPGSEDFAPVRDRGERVIYQIQPFWGELPRGSFRRRCDGCRKQTAFIVLETVLSLDPATRGGAHASAERFFRRFASTFLSQLPVEASFTARDVLVWLGAQKR